MSESSYNLRPRAKARSRSETRTSPGVQPPTPTRWAVSHYTNWRERARAWAAPGPWSCWFRDRPSSRIGDGVQAGPFTDPRRRWAWSIYMKQTRQTCGNGSLRELPSLFFYLYTLVYTYNHFTMAPQNKQFKSGSVKWSNRGRPPPVKHMRNLCIGLLVVISGLFFYAEELSNRPCFKQIYAYYIGFSMCELQGVKL